MILLGVRSTPFRQDQVPVLLRPTGKIWLFEASDSGDGFTRRQFDSASVDSEAILTFVEHQTGWSIDFSTPDPYHGTAISADVYSISIKHDKITLHYAKARGDDDDELVTISRPLTANEWRSLDSIIASIRKSNPVSEFIPLSKDGPQTKR